MKILIATPRLPYPPTDGGRIAMLHPIRHLAEMGHEVHVVTFAREDERSMAGVLRSLCTSVTCVSPPRLWWTRGLLFDPPATLARYFSTRMRRALEMVANRQRIDVVELETLHMAAYGRWLARYPRVFRPQNVEHRLWEQYASGTRSFVARTLLRLQARRIRRFERSALMTFTDGTLCLSHADRRALSALAPDCRIEMLPAGIDTEHFRPVAGAPVDPHTLVVTGSYEWAPKQRNLLALVEDVFPLVQVKVPDARLAVVGRGLPERLAAFLRSRSGVDYLGAVDDVRPYIAHAGIVVNYVEVGSGIAMKVLEAMAMGKAVVTNALGAEGVDAANGKEFVIVTRAEDFANEVCALMNDGARREELGRNARRSALEKYSSRSLARRHVEFLQSVVTSGAPVRPRRQASD